MVGDADEHVPPENVEHLQPFNPRTINKLQFELIMRMLARAYRPVQGKLLYLRKYYATALALIILGTNIYVTME